ncbi:hypothetical protein LEP14_23515 [Salmonella enterica]|uniref:gp53-like domain-containing protein n=8 Tax=Salmonella enterica TaxID=28901 RepID=UPI001CD66999|nr:hypothetical protein [Salmonella enterica]MCA1081035.1 hypothetical protein [Salmonella enterica]MCA1090395.1 hypothetical protein [Salmonella enterica]MCA1095299.1 hypothetical protein [Salmonella enterica]MCA1100292.1 hypothetical protein [Salmonella enterica]MCA1105320.1 hypothetical protein [Salmonella enterica]
MGEAAKRGVGASSGQLPDMGLFAANFAGGANSYAKFPNGLIIQTGAITSIPAGTSIEVFYPIAFPTQMCFVIFTAAGAADSTVPISIGVDAQSVTDSRKSVMARNFSTRSNAGTRFTAIGF